MVRTFIRQSSCIFPLWTYQYSSITTSVTWSAFYPFLSSAHQVHPSKSSTFFATVCVTLGCSLRAEWLLQLVETRLMGTVWLHSTSQEQPSMRLCVTWQLARSCIPCHRTGTFHYLDAGRVSWRVGGCEHVHEPVVMVETGDPKL